MSIPRYRQCLECGDPMYLQRTLTRRTWDGYDETAVWWVCRCGWMAHLSQRDAECRGKQLPRWR